MVAGYDDAHHVPSQFLLFGKYSNGQSSSVTFNDDPYAWGMSDPLRNTVIMWQTVSW